MELVEVHRGLQVEVDVATDWNLPDRPEPGERSRKSEWQHDA
jgi:hypothetical protein